jgi:hypothetical protein
MALRKKVPCKLKHGFLDDPNRVYGTMQIPPSVVDTKAEIRRSMGCGVLLWE